MKTTNNEMILVNDENFKEVIAMLVSVLTPSQLKEVKERLQGTFPEACKEHFQDIDSKQVPVDD